MQDRLELLTDHIVASKDINMRSNSVFVEPTQQAGSQQELIFLTVISIEHDTQRTIQLSRDATVAEAIYHFTKRNIVCLSFSLSFFLSSFLSSLACDDR